MLKTSHISNIQIYTEDWDRVRLGRFTSSRISVLMGDKFPSSGAMTYIYHKVGESITGRSTAEDEILEDENTQWGKDYEPDAIRRFSAIKGIEYLVTQKVIFDPDTRYSSTPDAIWVHGQSILKENEYNVSTLEVKCPRKYHRFISLYQCNTPADLKKEEPKYYWQVIDQMYNCDSALGYFACFHPLFPPDKNMKIIEFRKIDLWDEFKKMRERKDFVLAKFTELQSQFI